MKDQIQELIKKLLYGVPATGVDASKPVGLKHVYPEGTPLAPRLPFNEWAMYVQRQIIAH